MDLYNEIYSASGTRQLRLPNSASVSEAVRNGDWSFPPARSDNAVTLQVVLSSTSVPSIERGVDTYLWRNQSGGFGRQFSTKVTWDRLREPSPKVDWHDVVWFQEEIPRCSFLTWLAMLERLPTRDRLATWGLSVPENCVLCSSGRESHQHLFFGCSYAIDVWNRFCGRFISSPPSDLPTVGMLT